MKIGPATLVSAAFIGPGTVITCSIAGSSTGYTLLWALLFSIVTTTILQEMSGRITLATGLSLAEFVNQSTDKWVRITLTIVIVGAIAVGNAAYQSGNLTGGAMGIKSLLQEFSALDLSTNFYVATLSIIIFLVLIFGSYRNLEKFFVIVVLLMSSVFVLTMFVADVDWQAVIVGLLVPKAESDGFLLVVSLIGTTVVPYNLFLHSSAVKNHGWKEENIADFRFDLVFSILIGGIISMSILITSAAASVSDPTDLYDLSQQITPLLGKGASALFSLGIFAAGVTSSITAPLAAAYAVSGLLKINIDTGSKNFQFVWLSVLISGIVVSISGIKPLIVIQFAQFMNGLLLPLIAFLLLFLMNSSYLGKLKNNWLQNTIGLVVTLVVFGLGIKSILTLF